MKKFEQAKRLYRSLMTYADPEDLSDEMISAVSADFDRLFELCWKTLKEYLRETLAIREATTGSPKEILKLSYREGLISNEELWLSMLKDRNDDTHIYMQASAILYTERIHLYYLPFIGTFLSRMEKRIPSDGEAFDGRIPKELLIQWKKRGGKLSDYVESIRASKNLKSPYEVFSNWEKIKDDLDGI